MAPSGETGHGATDEDMAVNHHAPPPVAPTDPEDLGCPDLEEVAAFLDGTLPAERRAAIVEHLATCESCYEIFASVARFQADEQQLGTPEALPQRPFEGADRGLGDGPQDRVLRGMPAVHPGPPAAGLPGGRAGRWARRSRAWRRGAVAAMAALLVVSLGLPLAWWRLRAGEEISTEGLSARLLKSPAALQEVPWTGRPKRGPANQDLPPSLQEFRLGVRLLDLRLALAAGNRQGAIDTLRRLKFLLGTGVPVPEIINHYQAILEELGRPSPPPPTPAALLPKAEAEEKKLASLGVEGEYVDLGRWTEACRLSAAARQAELFRSRATRRLLERAQAPSAEPLGDQGADGGPNAMAAETLRKIKAAVAAQPLDLAALGSLCTELLDRLDPD